MSDETARSAGRTNRGMRRRDFLALGTATVAAAGLPRAAAAFSASASPLGLDLKQAAPLSVGYIVGSDAWSDLPDLPWQIGGVSSFAPYEIEVVPAERLVVGSELAGRQIELSVHGLVPGLPSPGTSAWKSAYLFASLPAPPDLPFGPDPVPFIAWSARADGDPRQAAKVRPVLETGLDGSLYLGLEIRSPGTKSGAARPGGSDLRAEPGIVLRSANFTVDAIAGRPKLQAGVYLLAFAAGLWRRPWSGDVSDLASQPGLESVAIGVLPLD